MKKIIFVLALALFAGLGLAANTSDAAVTLSKDGMAQANNPYCRADLNCDGTVNWMDYLIFQNCYPCEGVSKNCPDCACADFNQDNAISVSDHLIMLAALGTSGCTYCCESN